jgi:hypothetical protein
MLTKEAFLCTVIRGLYFSETGSQILHYCSSRMSFGTSGTAEQVK